MAQAMLGKLPLSAVQRSRDTLEGHIAGDEGPWWLKNLKRFNRKEFREMRDDFPVWMTIYRWWYEDFRDFIGTTMTLGCRYTVGQKAEVILEDTYVSRNVAAEVDLVLVSPAQLGFTEEVEYGLFLRASIAAGLECCQPGDALELRRQYLSQPRGERVCTATEPIHVAGYDSGLFLLILERQGILTLGTRRLQGAREVPISPEELFTFVRPR